MKNIYFADFSCMHGRMCVYGRYAPDYLFIIPVVLVPSFAVSVTKDFLRDCNVSPVPNSQPGGPVDHFSSDLYLSTCPGGPDRS